MKTGIPLLQAGVDYLKHQRFFITFFEEADFA